MNLLSDFPDNEQMHPTTPLAEMVLQWEVKSQLY